MNEPAHLRVAEPEGRLPPHNLDAERSLLGGILLDGQALPDARAVVQPTEFYREIHRKVFAAMCSLDDRQEPVDRVTVKAELVSMGFFDQVGGDEYLDLLDKFVPTAANLGYYAKIVAGKALARRLIEAGGSIAQLGYEQHGDVGEFAGECERRIIEAAASHTEVEFETPRTLIAATCKAIEGRYERNTIVSGLPSNLEELDALTCGFQDQDLVIVAARPSMGKSSFLFDILAETCKANFAPKDEPLLGGDVALFSLEMSKQSCIEKLIAREARIDLQIIRNGQLKPTDWERMAVAMDRISGWGLHIIDEPAQSAQVIRARARRLASRLARNGRKLRAVGVDYLQLMGGNQNLQREERVSESSRIMKALAKELKLPVFLLSQLNREVEKRPDKRPMMSDIRESGSVEQDADAILFLFRQEFYERDKPELAGKAEVIVAKQRMGPVGTAHVAWTAPHNTFCNLGQEPIAKPRQLALGEPPPHSDEDAP